MKVSKLVSLFIVSVFSFIYVNSLAQGTIQDSNGRLIKSSGYSDIQGSPYLFKDWMTGVVKTANGNSYKNVKIKFNVKDNEVVFLGSSGEAFVFTEPVVEFTLQSDGTSKDVLRFKNGFNAIPGVSPKDFVEILTEGTVQLVKIITKNIVETKEFNSNAVQSFVDGTKYYLIVDGKTKQVKPDKKSVIAVLPNKKAEIESYVESNKLNLKNDSDFAQLIIYCNSN